MGATPIEFDETSHTYTVLGRKLPSVTQVINAVLPVDYHATDWHMERGSIVHECAAMIAHKQEFEADPQIEGRVESLRKFWYDMKPEPVLIEKRMASEKLLFAGTPDLLAIALHKILIVDYKACDDPRTWIQLGGYALLLDEAGFKCEGGLYVRVSDDGQYKMSEVRNLKNERREFLAVLSVYNIMRKIGAIK